jgi:hypothetical protein
MVALQDVNKIHVIDKPITKEEVRLSILEGATFAGWSAQELDSDTILATYLLRTHTVNVRIAYTESSYGIRYKSSHDMKMYCTKKDSDKKQGKIVSGVQNCPGGMPPYAIHGAYQTWVDELNRAIQAFLVSK